MDFENIKRYVYHYSNNFVSIGLLRCMIFGLAYLTGMCSVFGVVGKGTVLMITKFLIALTFLYVVFVVVLPKLWKPEEFSHRFVVNGFSAVFMAIYFEMVALLIAFIEVDNRLVFVYICFMIVGTLINVLLSFCLTIRKIKQGKFKKNVKRKRKTPVVVTIGALSGILLAKVVLGGVSQKEAIAVGVFVFFSVACVFIYGTTNFLKYYYVKKYSFPSDGLEDVIAMQLHPPKKRKKARK